VAQVVESQVAEIGRMRPPAVPLAQRFISRPRPAACADEGPRDRLRRHREHPAPHGPTGQPAAQRLLRPGRQRHDAGLTVFGIRQPDRAGAQIDMLAPDAAEFRTAHGGVADAVDGPGREARCKPAAGQGLFGVGAFLGRGNLGEVAGDGSGERRRGGAAEFHGGIPFKGGKGMHKN